MAKLVWGTVGERFFETGVDRGVLYVNAGIGVAWNGLTKVNETPSGGDPKPYYLDGIKYLNVSAMEEFEATIEAFSYPPEFAVCDGSLAIGQGLFITQQPRRSFGFSYRTIVGNDIAGPDFGYKIHIVYNALAGSSEKSNNTVTNSADPITFSWPITATPPAISGHRPTAHIIIDTRYTTESKLDQIEDILYGTSMLTPRIPTISELITIFNS